MNPQATSSEWTNEEIALLGKESDPSLARRLGRSLAEVRAQRWSRKIKPWWSPSHVGTEPAIPEKVRLCFGPYFPPTVNRQGKLECVLRGKVPVDSYSHAPIPWPKKAQSLILCGDLIKAVRQESAMAVAYHWRVSLTIVVKWRRVLGVPSINAGTQQLKRFTTLHAMTPDLRSHLSEVKKGQPVHYTPTGKQRMLEAIRQPKSARWRQKMAKHFAARCGQPVNPNTRVWTPEEDKLLGTKNDEEIAKRISRTVGAVRTRRIAKGVPNPNPQHWTEEEIKMLHAFSPQEVVQRTGRTLKAVMYKREELRIIMRPAIRPWTPEEERLLGTHPDTQLARILGRSRSDVRSKRVALGVEPAQEHALYKYWTPEEDKLLGTGPDHWVAKQVGRSKACVVRRRLALGLASYCQNKLSTSQA